MSLRIQSQPFTYQEWIRKEDANEDLINIAISQYSDNSEEQIKISINKIFE